MQRTDVINHLIKEKGYKSYLEIGVQYPQSNFFKVNAEYKTGVEPYPVADMLNKSIVELTSDMFFKSLEDNVKYDIIFIDGLHTREQCRQDIYNSLKHLNEGGCILVHDCLPTAEYQTSKDDNGKEWTGDVWKAIVDIQYRKGVNASTIDTDWGIGYITQDYYTNELTLPDGISYDEASYTELDWETYTQMKNGLLNIKTIDQWIKSL
jgi:hypothetical protein